MFKFFFYLFGSVIVFHLLTKKYLNPYKLIMIFGKKGSGKTTTLTKIALHDIKRGKIVYSTIPIPGTRLFKVEDVGFRQFEEGATILIDEVG